MGMWDGAAASNDEKERTQDEDLKRTPLPATGICRIENGAADVTHVDKDAVDAPGTQPDPRASRAPARCSARPRRVRTPDLQPHSPSAGVSNRS